MGARRRLHHNCCVCFAFALRTSQVFLVGNSSWFFKIDFAHQLFPHGFQTSFCLPVIFTTIYLKLIEISYIFDAKNKHSILVFSPIVLLTELLRVLVHTFFLRMDVRTSFFPVVPQDLSMLSHDLALRDHVCISKLLDIQLRVILTIFHFYLSAC